MKPIIQKELDTLEERIRAAELAIKTLFEIFGDSRPGRVPASGGGSLKFLRADRTWAVPSGGAATVSDGSYGDVTVSVAGTVWTVASLPESRITGLVADLAARVPTTRAISTTAPLRIDGGSSANLSADRALTINAFSTSASGIASASGAATNILLGDNTWVSLASLIALLQITLAQFGDGSDGAATMDGSTAVAGCTRTGNTYEADRNTFFTNLTVNSGISFNPAGYPVNVHGTLTNNGTIHSNGGNATGSTGGTQPWTGTHPLPNGLAGATAGTNGSNASNAAPQEFSITAAVGGAAGSPATAGTAGGIGHGGGGGGTETTVGGNGGTISLKLQTSGHFRQWISAMNGRDSGGFVVFTVGSPGGGGANAGGVTFGGAAGASAGWVVVSAIAFAGSGVYQARGGNGAPGFNATGTNSGGGGGGGGGGGIFVIVCGTGTPPTPDVSGGTAGAGGAAGSAPGIVGAAGGAGGAGKSVIFS